MHFSIVLCLFREGNIIWLFPIFDEWTAIYVPSRDLETYIFLDVGLQSTPLNSRKLRQSMQKRAAGSGLMAKTLKRRPDKSVSRTPNSADRKVKKRKPLVLSSDSSLEDARAPESHKATGAAPAAVIKPNPDVDIENQLLNGAENVMPHDNTAGADNDIDDDLEAEIPAADGADETGDTDHIVGDEEMEVDNVGMQHLPFHNDDDL